MKNYFIKKGNGNYVLYTKEGEEVAFATKRADLVALAKEKERLNKPQLIANFCGSGRPI